MSTGCQKVSQTDRMIYSADRMTERQNDSMTVWQNSRAAKEPALVFNMELVKKCRKKSLNIEIDVS